MLIRPPPSYDPTVALCIGTYVHPRGVGVSYERGAPVRSAVLPLAARYPRPAESSRHAPDTLHSGFIDSCITQLLAHGSFRTCNERKDEFILLGAPFRAHNPEPSMRRPPRRPSRHTHALARWQRCGWRGVTARASRRWQRTEPTISRAVGRAFSRPTDSSRHAPGNLHLGPRTLNPQCAEAALNPHSRPLRHPSRQPHTNSLARWQGCGWRGAMAKASRRFQGVTRPNLRRMRPSS